MTIRYILLCILSISLYSDLIAQNPGSANLKGTGRIRVTDANPVNPLADPGAYAVTGDSITVEAWVFPMGLPEAGNGHRIVIRPYNENPFQSYSLSIDNFVGEDFPQYSFIISDGTPGNFGIASDTVITTLGVWTHVAGTYDGISVKLYINGNLVNETPYTADIGAGETGFYISGLLLRERFQEFSIERELQLRGASIPKTDAERIYTPAEAWQSTL